MVRDWLICYSTWYLWTLWQVHVPPGYDARGTASIKSLPGMCWCSFSKALKHLTLRTGTCSLPSQLLLNKNTYFLKLLVAHSCIYCQQELLNSPLNQVIAAFPSYLTQTQCLFSTQHTPPVAARHLQYKRRTIISRDVMDWQNHTTTHTQKKPNYKPHEDIRHGELSSRTHQLPKVLHGIFQYPSSCFWLLQFIVNADKVGRERSFHTAGHY